VGLAAIEAGCGALDDRPSRCKLSRSTVGWVIVCAASAGSIETIVDVVVERESCSKQRCENNANLLPQSSSCMPKI
jgi:hypothetical protein